MSAIARACGLSQTGLTHHFHTKADVLAAVLERRDEIDAAWMGRPRGWAAIETLVELTRYNENHRGLVMLFTTLSAEAVEADHPANAWLLAHHARSRQLVRRGLTEAIEDGELRQDTPVEALARILPAVLDGLQVQWLSDPEHTSMAAEVRVTVNAIRAAYRIS